MSDTILDSVEESKNLKKVGFGPRFVAAIIDGIIMWVVNIPITLLLTGDMMQMDAGSAYAGMGLIATIINYAINIGYFVYMESSAYQGTAGKLVMGIKVVSTDGSRITASNSLGRWFSKIVSGIILLIGYLMVLWDNDKQALHDKMAHTYVVEK